MTHENRRVVVIPENRYDLLSDSDGASDLTVVVVIPVYNGADRLMRVLAGFRNQSRPPDEMVVADDGSDEDIAAVVERFSDLQVRHERQEHNGFGAGRARNLGVRCTTSEVVLFVDSDCIPHSRLVESHLKWHARSGNLVVVGNRYHVDDTELSDKTDDAMLREMAREIPDDGAPDDWRKMFYSKNRWLRTGDDAFRAFVTSNVSVTRTALESVGGFSEEFKGWGGEDTELGWRLWNSGATFAVEPDATVFHQVSRDDTRESREESRRKQRIALADVIPHRFYRRGGGAFYSVPKCSWIVNVESAEETLHVLNAISRSTYHDTEIVAVGSRTALEPLDAMGQSSRVTLIAGGTVADAVGTARGEFVVLVDGRIAVNPKFVSSAMALFQSSHRLAYVRGAYLQHDGSVTRTVADIETLDAMEGRDDMPLLAIVHRREVMKDIAAGEGMDWAAVVARSKEGLVFEASELAGVNGLVNHPSRLGVGDMRRAGPGQVGRAAARVVGRATRRKQTSERGL